MPPDFDPNVPIAPVREAQDIIATELIRHGWLPQDAAGLKRTRHSFAKKAKTELGRAGSPLGVQLPVQSKEVWPRNAPLLLELEQKFGPIGFKFFHTVSPHRGETVRFEHDSEGHAVMFVDGALRRLSHEQASKPVASGSSKLEPVATFFYESAGEKKVVAEYRNARVGISYEKLPTISGQAVTLVELYSFDAELFDGMKASKPLFEGLRAGSRVPDFGTVRERTNATGIGYKGMGGTSWHMCPQTLPLPQQLHDELTAFGKALFVLNDVVRTLWIAGDPAVHALLTHKVPAHIPRIVADAPVMLLRPDLVLVENGNGGYSVVCTEIESCGAGLGMAYSLQVQYGMSHDHIDAFVRMLAGRDFVVMATHHWAEYIREVMTFMSALKQRGVKIRYILDRKLDEIQQLIQPDGIRPDLRWVMPGALPAHLKASWSTDLIGQLQRTGFIESIEDYDEADLPQDVGDAVVFRFGYSSNFSPNVTALMETWRAAGAEFLNPVQHYLENKAFLGSAWLKSVCSRITEQYGAEHVATLHRCLATTSVLGLALDPTWVVPNIFSDEDERGYQARAVIKYAGMDDENQSWGARSVLIGSRMTTPAWERAVAEYKRKLFPAVQQVLINSVQFDVGYVDHTDTLRLMAKARTRLTPFMMRTGPGLDSVQHVAHMLTLRPEVLVHGASNSAETMLEFK